MDIFNKSMEELGYESVSDSFLVKNFDNLEVSITRRNNIIESLIGYSNEEIVKIPEHIIIQVKNDINKSL